MSSNSTDPFRKLHGIVFDYTATCFFLSLSRFSLSNAKYIYNVWHRFVASIATASDIQFRHNDRGCHQSTQPVEIGIRLTPIPPVYPECG